MPEWRRHCWQATGNGGRAKGGRINAMGHRPCQINLQKQGFLVRKAKGCGVNLNLRVDAISCFQTVKTNAREVDLESARVNGAPLKEMTASGEKEKVCFSLGHDFFTPIHSTKEQSGTGILGWCLLKFLFVPRGFVVTLHFWVENSQRTVPASFCHVIRVHCLGNAHLSVLPCPPPSQTPIWIALNWK